MVSNMFNINEDVEVEKDSHIKVTVEIDGKK
jgi:hypothetical protein